MTISSGARRAGFLRAPAWKKREELLVQVWKLALPVMLTYLLQSLVYVIDVFMVGRLGPMAIAAVGMGSTIRMLVMVMMLSVAAGSMSLVAQAKGARDPERMSYVTRQAISAGVLMALGLTVIGLFLARPLLELANSGGNPTAVELGYDYLIILFAGTVFMVLNITINRLMQGAGDTVTPLILTGSLNVLNVIFNYVLMFGVGPIPAFGVAGAAIGTILSRAIGVAIALFLVYSGRNVIKLLPGSYRPDWRIFSDIFAIGVPSGVQGIFRNGSRLLVIGLITSTEVGSYGAAALAIGFQLESLIFMPGLGISVAATSLVGQSIGSWQLREARASGNTAIALGVVVMAVLAAPIIYFASPIIRLFDPSADPTLLATATTYLHINTVFLPLSAIAMIANGSLRGAGDTVPGLISTIVARAVIAVSLAYVLAFPLGMGSMGVWIALVVGVVLDAIFMGWRWRGRVWEKVALRRTEVYRQHLRDLPSDVQQEYLREVRAPLMAQPTAREYVDEHGVDYRTTDRETKVTFQADGYTTSDQPIG